MRVTAVILLIRHAAHVELGRILSGRKRDVALSSEGIEQARIVADLLGVEPVDTIVSSPRERAYYTAREIAEPHDRKVRIADALDELDFGEWTGMSFDSLEGDPAWQDWNERRSESRPPGGETMAEAVERAAELIESLAAEHDGGLVAAVTHCDVIRGLIARYLGLGFDDIHRFDVDPASVSRLVIGSWGARINSINERLYR